MKEIIKKIIPYGYMQERRLHQKEEILKNQEEPLIYNKNGNEKRVFYLKDTLSQHTPYTMVLGQNPETILWDRNNIGLPVQFYTHEHIFGHINKYAKKRFAMLFESETIRGEDFQRAIDNPDIMKSFDKVFTFSDRLLDKYENAVFAPASGLWYGTKENGGALDDTRYEKKDKNISVIASNKQSTEFHKLRLQIARDAKNTGKVDAYGAFCGNRIEKKADALDRYRYSIVVENDVKPYYFTEKVLDCFASMTVPIYVGATKINKFFNEQGIIQVSIDDCKSIEGIIDSCNNIDYERRLFAVKDNFERVKQYRCIEDYIYCKYKEEFIIN